MANDANELAALLGQLDWQRTEMWTQRMGYPLVTRITSVAWLAEAIDAAKELRDSQLDA